PRICTGGWRGYRWLQDLLWTSSLFSMSPADASCRPRSAITSGTGRQINWQDDEVGLQQSVSRGATRNLGNKMGRATERRSRRRVEISSRRQQLPALITGQ